MIKTPLDRQSSENPLNSGPVVQKALKLIRSQRTMVLATSQADMPWTAPVYYVYSPPGFYFFSDPAARHIAQAQGARPTAAAIFSDSDAWEKIQGLQMTGTIQAVVKHGEQLKVLGRFLHKFPMAKPFLQAAERAHSAELSVRDKVQLYVFQPKAIFYLNNQLGFGRRLAIALL